MICPSLKKAVIVDLDARRKWEMRQRLTAWANVMTAFRESKKTRMVMLLLTYEKVEDYEPGHIRLFIKNLKQRLEADLLAFAWVAELQARGAVHYHIVLIVNPGTNIPLPDKSGMWKYGISGIHTARTPWYILKYTGKEKQKDFARYPRYCRVYAASVRTTEGNWKASFKMLAGVKNMGNDDEIEDQPEWKFGGVSYTEEFARTALIPPGVVVS